MFHNNVGFVHIARDINIDCFHSWHGPYNVRRHQHQQLFIIVFNSG
ncbi:MAG: hypothetical protein GQ549_08355 [Gammaproteobacteria bacterium]|nr:hypothetical protein [Gammaproteobacteria bacterium]